jgi:glycerol-3-phosphate O-acyltransferase
MISVRKWLGGGGGLKEKVEGLGREIVREMSRRLVVAGPAIISAVVLMNRKGISDDSLQEQSSWLAKEVSSRGVKITRSQADSSISVGSSLELLEGVLRKSQKDMFEVQVSFDQNSFVQLFTLTYYRNTLTHIFFE